MLSNIGVAIITRGGLRRVGESVLRSVVNSLWREFGSDARLMIVVDDGGDGTGRFLCSLFWGECLLASSSAGSRGSARWLAIELFLSSGLAWLLFVDDDCVLRRGWRREAEALLSYASGLRVGGIWGINYDSTPDRRVVLGDEYAASLMRFFWVRGGMHDTLIPREVLEEASRVPNWLNVYEDAYIVRQVSCLGYTWLINVVGCTHVRGWIMERAVRDERARLGELVELGARLGVLELGSARAVLSRPKLPRLALSMVKAFVKGVYNGARAGKGVIRSVLVGAESARVVAEVARLARRHWPEPPRYCEAFSSPQST